MPTKQAHIGHYFGGGWATDFGPHVPGLSADQNGNLIYPFLVNADDCFYDLDGGPITIPGTVRVNSSQLESGARVKAAFDYWRMGTAGSPSQRRVIFIGTKVYADTGNGTFTEIKSGLSSDAVPHMALFDDILILANDNTADVPMSYDGTTFQNLAGSPPNFSFSESHHNYMFAAGVAAAPSTLYYSGALDPESWTGGTSGNISIDPDDGDMITGIKSHKNNLIVFKGPYKGSIHRITGTSNSTWARQTLVRGVGAVWQNSIFRFQDDLGFLWSDGTVRSLTAVEAFGDYRDASMSRPIDNRYLIPRCTTSRLRHAWAVSDGRRVYLCLPVDGSNQPNVILACDYRFDPPRWSRLPSMDNYACAMLGIDPDSSNRHQVFLGTSDGYLEKWGQARRSVVNGTSSFNYLVTTPFIDYGIPADMKTLAAVGVGFNPMNNNNVTIRWRRDGNTAQSTTVTQGGAAVLGGVTGFILGNSQATTGDTLADNRFVDRFVELEEGGEFRTIQYEFENTTVDMATEIHSFVSHWEPGGESTEN